VVRSRQQLISNASLNCALLDIDGLALVNCFEKTNGMRDVNSACILNIGHTFTTLVIMEEKKPPFIRDILQGGSQLIEHVAAERNLTREAAARAVIGPSDGQLSDVLASGAVKLIGEINETLRYYIREQRLQAIDKVYVCGGFSLVDGFVDILSRQIIFGATLWNPFEHIGKQPEATGLEILDKAGPAFAVAAGLAMRTI
jgi:type IV pilus assembly protein PilM